MASMLKIILKESENYCFFEQLSLTVLKGSEEAVQVILDNTYYDDLLSGKGKNVRYSDAETQTSDILLKSRSTNTERINKINVATFVSNYDMYDTYADLETSTENFELQDHKQMKITTYTGNAVDYLRENLNNNENFRISSMIIERLLAGNVFEERQMAFRNMCEPSPLDINAKYLYKLKTLWIYKMLDTLGTAVSCVSWCEANTDIIAIGYGIYSFVPKTQRREGYICIWSIKNPVNPERYYKFHVPITSLCFSKKNPQLLAVGLYNGSIDILDITSEDIKSIGKSDRSTSPGFEPIWGIRWIQGGDLFGINEQILTISQDGRVMKYNFITGPHLFGYQQLRLNRIEGVIEGIPVVKRKELIEANRRSQANFITMHPLKSDIYFIGTDEGCLIRSSINFPHQYKMQVHNGGVFGMEFSPWSPKIFLTCGSDFYIRIWIDGIFQPICELSSGFNSVHAIDWSPINPTMFASVSRSGVEIWDLKRKSLKPAAIHNVESTGIALTLIKFTHDGRTLVVGDEEGKTHVCALQDIPFPPYYRFLDLQNTIFKLLECDPLMLKQVKSIGHLGY